MTTNPNQKTFQKAMRDHQEKWEQLVAEAAALEGVVKVGRVRTIPADLADPWFVKVGFQTVFWTDYEDEAALFASDIYEKRELDSATASHTEIDGVVVAVTHRKDI